MELFERAKKFTEAPGVSGFEEMAFDTVKELCEDFFTEIKTTSTGSVIAYRPCGKPNAKKLLLDAHLDEIGMVVTKICDGGFLKVTNCGGIDTRVLSAGEVYIYGKKTITGVICSKPPHLTTDEDRKKKILLKDMAIDTGYTKEELEEIVSVGTPVGFKVKTERLGKDFATGKSFDDRICGTVILRAIELLKDKELNVDIYALFSGGEETNYVGSRPGAFIVDPDYAVVIDVCNCAIPETPKFRQTNFINKGGVISYSSTTSRKLTQKLIDTAKENGIPHQVIAEAGYTGTNATMIQIARAGIPTVLISIPLKNMHTPAEIGSLKDVENTALAVAALAERLGGEDL
ncbi:MAG: M42 family metallopeptidase [Ruminococcaceae bacterium]|nr:M42 family metallopeptidase [Oscillospiraceae bacterium]